MTSLELNEKKLVVNLSNHNLTKPQNNVLALGLNFATNPKRVPYTDIVAATEQVTKSLPSTEGQQLRETVKSCLDKYGNRPPIPTLNQVERTAIKSPKK